MWISWDLIPVWLFWGIALLIAAAQLFLSFKKSNWLGLIIPAVFLLALIPIGIYTADAYTRTPPIHGWPLDAVILLNAIPCIFLAGMCLLIYGVRMIIKFIKKGSEPDVQNQNAE